MNRTLLTFVALITFVSCAQGEKKQEPITLKDTFKEYFLIGAAANAPQIRGENPEAVEVLLREFNSIVAENCMKAEVVQPREGEFDFADADRFIEFGEKNGMFIIGHTLIWHSQAPKWFFSDKNGKDVSREVMIERMRTHINTVVGRYKGRVQGWDVLNEAINDDGTLRQSKFLQIIGEDYIDLAFQFTHEADPEAELYYNDYSMFKPEKCATAVAIVNRLKSKGLRIDGIGMQCHYLMEGPEASEVERSIKEFAKTGAKVMITEMELSILKLPSKREGAEVSATEAYQAEYNPYADGNIPAEVLEAWEKRYLSYFDVFVRNAEAISRVTLWGIDDNMSWKNDWPMAGRTDYPLLFDREYKAKPVVEKIINLTKK